VHSDDTVSWLLTNCRTFC